MDDGNSKTTRLLTLLNVSAIKAGNRKRIYDDQFQPSVKLNKRKAVQFDPEPVEKEDRNEEVEIAQDIEMDEQNNGEDIRAEDPYEAHFGVMPPILTESSRDAVDRREYKVSKERRGKLWWTADFMPESVNPDLVKPVNDRAIIDKLRIQFKSQVPKLPPNDRQIQTDDRQIQTDLLSTLSSHRDLYLTSISLPIQKCTRDAISLHILNHITKKRLQILKNNDRTSKSPDNPPPPESVQDQGFTRPSTLILLPFRSSALSHLTSLSTLLPPKTQIENHSRFLSEYGLPTGVTDKLAQAEEEEPGKWPSDHVAMFKGNCDDNFRVGVKLTRKSLKVYAEFYGADLILASPLGLRMAIEKGGHGDFLSSIEILVVDQMDALTMQNWEHVQFVFSHLNKLPKESHNTDISRIKPWYLDGYAAYLRQTVLLTAYETPFTRSLFNTTLKNVAGNIRTENKWAAVGVPQGVEQNFVHFDCTSPQDEADKRFHHFTTQLLPAVLKSAVQSANTVVFIPSSFDFIRVHNYFRKNASGMGVGFTVLSEYSSNKDISRARQAFFGGKKAFLLVSERFHFYRRYAIRGIRNLIFYAPPDHAQFYTEFLSYPFLDDGVEAEDLTCRVLYGKYDWFAVERIVGTEGVKGVMKRN